VRNRVIIEDENNDMGFAELLKEKKLSFQEENDHDEYMEESSLPSSK
jgi:hypothetical protein